MNTKHTPGKRLSDMSSDDLYRWAIQNASQLVDPIEPGEWFLHRYGSSDLTGCGDVPDWGDLAYRAELLEALRRHGVYGDVPPAAVAKATEASK